MINKLMERIKSRGYWRVNFRPLVYENKIISLGECKDIIEKSGVRYRGWTYPHFPKEPKDHAMLEPRNNYYLGWIDWDCYKEFWHMYQSGQFLHYLALREDWLDESDYFLDERLKNIKPGTGLEITSAVYQLTEVYEFLSRLVRLGIYDEGVSIKISLKNTLDRVLFLTDIMKTPLNGKYQCRVHDINFEKKYTKEEVLSQPNELALNTICYFFDLFGWHRPPIETLRNDQLQLIKK